MKWAKAEAETNTEDVDAVSEFYQVNRERAKEYLKLIRSDELDFIKNRVSKGGASEIGGRGRKKL